MKRFAIALCMGSLAACATTPSPPPPLAYPDFDFDQAESAVAVVRVAPGDELPNFPEDPACRDPGIVCIQMHYPLWFKAKVIDTVYGTLPAERLAVATASHYGLLAYEHADKPWLAWFVVRGNDVVMPTYASDELFERKDGELFLAVTHDREPWFLPCPVAALREKLDPAQFSRALRLERDAYVVKQDPAFYQVTSAGAWPRWGIRVSRLRDYLATLQPSSTSMTCEQENAT